MLTSTKHHHTEINLIAVSCSKAITKGILKKILKHCGNYDRIFSLSDKEINYFCQQKNKQFEGKDYLLDQAITILNACEEKEIKILTILHPSYPYLLRQIYNPPLLLYYKGNIKPLLQKDKIKISIIGTRKADKHILAQTQKISQHLTEKGIYVISGMAHGVDTFAHRGALAASTNDNHLPSTAAILGCGIDVIYPYGNLPLYRLILEKDGVIVSEYPPGTEPTQYHFPERNRIIAGLAHATLLMQAGKKSGALISVEYAIAENREVMVYQNYPHNTKEFAGNQKLLEDGALSINSCADLDTCLTQKTFSLENTFKLSDNKSKSPSQETLFTNINSINSPNSNYHYHNLNNLNKSAATTSNIPIEHLKEIENLTDIDKKIMQALIKQQPATISALSQALALSTDALMPRLFHLLLNDLIIELPGKQYCQKNPVCPNLLN